MGQIPAYSNPLALSQRYSMENGTKHYITKSRGRLRVVKNRTQHSCTNCRKRKVKVSEYTLSDCVWPNLRFEFLSAIESSHALLAAAVGTALNVLMSPVSRVASI